MSRKQQETNVVPIGPRDGAAVADPLELQAAEKLRDLLARYNAAALERLTVSPTDAEALEAIAELSGAMQRQAGRAYERDVPAEISQIDRDVTAYIRTNRGRVNLSISDGDAAGDTVSAPALESAAVRAHIAEKGAQLIAAIEGAIRAGREREARKAEDLARLREAAHYWASQPVTGALLRAFVVMVDSDTRLGFDHIERALYITQYAAHGAATEAGERVYRPLPTADVASWRAWLPFVREAFTGKKASAA